MSAGANCYRVIFHLDGSGLYYDPFEPPHLDAMMAWVLAPHQGIRHLDRGGIPSLVRLPIKSSLIHGAYVWHASALFPDGPTGEAIWYWRKRFRQGRAELTGGSPNLAQGTYRDWQMPLPMLMTRRLVGYVRGKRQDIRKCLEGIRYVGKKRAHGHGKVLGWDIQPMEQDYSLVKDGLAMRYLPDPRGIRMVRSQPPYWHHYGRIACCDVGDPVSID